MAKKPNSTLSTPQTELPMDVDGNSYELCKPPGPIGVPSGAWASSPRTEAQDPYIFPIMRFGDEKHILEDLDEAGEQPVLKSVGFSRMGGNWVSYTMTTQGRNVLSIEVSEPDVKQIAEDQAKIAFVQTLQDPEF